MEEEKKVFLVFKFLLKIELLGNYLTKGQNFYLF